MSLALTEAFSNILRHAVPPEVDSVDMTLTFDGETICVSFEYPGIPFDPSTIPTPDFTGESDGGFGYFIIEQLTDNVAYAFGENGRHRVDLRWVYPEQAPLEI